MRAHSVKLRSGLGSVHDDPSPSGLLRSAAAQPCGRVGTLFASVAPARIPNSYPGGLRRRSAGTFPRSRLLRARRSGGGAQLQIGVFQPSEGSATRHPAQRRPRPAGVERMRSRDQTSLAPVGTRPVSENRQSAMSSLRASATIITRRMRPRDPAVRSLNHLLSALSGLIAQPAPSHLYELCPDPSPDRRGRSPGRAACPSARPRGWRQADPAREFATVAEPAVEDLIASGTVASFGPIAFSRVSVAIFAAARVSLSLGRIHHRDHLSQTAPPHHARPRPARSALPREPADSQSAESPAGPAAETALRTRSSRRQTSPRKSFERGCTSKMPCSLRSPLIEFVSDVRSFTRRWRPRCKRLRSSSSIVGTRTWLNTAASPRSCASSARTIFVRIYPVRLALLRLPVDQKARGIHEQPSQAPMALSSQRASQKPS